MIRQGLPALLKLLTHGRQKNEAEPPQTNVMVPIIVIQAPVVTARA